MLLTLNLGLMALIYGSVLNVQADETILDTSKDCQVSSWSGWSPCNGHCYSNEERPFTSRYRRVVTYPAGQGAECPHLVEWQSCGGGYPCPICDCTMCHRSFALGSNHWCLCCASGFHSDCDTCRNQTIYDFNDCVAQGWGTSLCRG